MQVREELRASYVGQNLRSIMNSQDPEKTRISVAGSTVRAKRQAVSRGIVSKK